MPPHPFDDEAFSLVRVCRAAGHIVTVDVFITATDQANAYIHVEKLRNPSHIQVLLLEELEELFVLSDAVRFAYPIAVLVVRQFGSP